MKSIKIACCVTAAAACVCLLSGCVFWNGPKPQNERSKAIDQTSSLSDGISSLHTNISVGNVAVSYGSDQTVTVHAVIKANHGNAADSQKLLGLTDVATEQKDGTLTVAVYNRDTHIDIWQWIKKNMPNTNYSVDLQLVVPQALHTFQLNTKVGDIRTESLNGTISAQADVGDVDAENTVFSGDSTLQARVGNVTCGFVAATMGNGTLKLRSDVGNVQVRTADGTVPSQSEKKTVTGRTLQGILPPSLALDASARVGKVSVAKN